MKITIVHLSDFHFEQDSKNHCTDLIDKLSASIASHSSGEELFLLVTGDVAFSGLKEEYLIASEYFEKLQREIQSRTGMVPKMLIVPGNHDCDFKLAGQPRDIIIRDDFEGDITQETYDLCRSVQVEYDEFEKSNMADPDQEESGIGFRVVSFDVSGKKIAFRMHNSAWMSTRREEKRVVLPVVELSGGARESLERADVSIAMMHHTFYWLNRDCSKALIRDLHATCDLVLTGHEHDSDMYRRLGTDGSDVGYLEGGALQAHGKAIKSSYNLINIDLDTENIEVFQYALDGDIYSPENSFKLGFARNVKRLKAKFGFSEQFKAKLDDLDIAFKHPYKKNLTLTDLFVYPECQEAVLPGAKTKRKIIKETSFKIFNDNPCVYLAGPEKSGKTTFAKRLVEDFQSQGVITVYAKGKNIKKSDAEGLLNYISGLIAEQYSKESVEPFLQLKKEEKAIIIDDYDQLKIKGKGREKLISEVTGQFGKVLFLGHNDSRWEEIYQAATSSDGDYTPRILNFSHYELLELGPLKRSDLVNKWLNAGAGREIDPDEQHVKSVKAEGIITQTIGKNLLPAYPLFVLMLIQQLESGSTNTTAHGAQGYLYESLITLSLRKTSKGEAADLDIKYRYLSDLAFLLYTKDEHEISRNEFSDWHLKYCDENLIQYNFDRLLSDFIEATILSENNNTIHFVYPYIRYYFTARHISENVQKEDYKNLILDLTKDLHRQESANILIFLSYLCRDKYILDTLVSTAKSLFDTVLAFNFSDPPSFLRQIETSSSKLVLKGLTPSQSRKEELARVESLEREKEHIEVECPIESEEKDILDNTNNVVSAVKTIQILGQILRSYPGSLGPQNKIKIAQECYELGLRTMAFYSNFLGNNKEEISEKLIQMVSDLHPECSQKDLEIEASAFLYNLCGKMCFGMVKHISTSVGLEELTPVFRKLLEVNDSFGYKLIDLSIRLDHYNNFPKHEAIARYEEASGVAFTTNIIRNLAWYHMRMFPVPYAVTQSVCAKLNIEFQPYDKLTAGRLLDREKK